MTRRLGGIGRRSLTGLASVSLAATLACGFAVTGCGGDSGGGGDSGNPETGVIDAARDGTTESGPLDSGPDVRPDISTPPPDAGQQCPVPTFAPASGTVAAGTMVSISGIPTGGFIFYSAGTLPNHNSPVYAGPFAVNQTETIYAIAYAPGAGGCLDSTPANATYTVTPVEAGPPPDAPPPAACATPTFAPVPGAFTTPQNVTVSTTTPNATIFYTTNGTNPTTASTVYATPLPANQTETIRAICTAPGFGPSAVGVGTYTINIPPGTVAPPVFSQPGGTPQNNAFNLTLTSATPNATICYAFNTTAATCTNMGACAATSTSYSGAGVAINGTVTDAATGQVTVNAIACAPNSTPSAPVSQTYTLQAAAPQFIPGPGTLAYTGATTASPSISTATNGTDVQIRYTTGATVATCQTATLLAGPYPATLPVATSVTYNAITCKPGFAPSAVTTAPYIVQLNPPTFDVPGAAFDNTVAVTLAINGATNPGPVGDWVCYSITGQAACGATANTCATGSVAGTTLTVTTNGTVIDALTCAPAGYQNSGHVQSGTYMLQLAPLSFTPNGGSLGVAGTQNVTIAMTDQANGIRYTGICSTNDGTTPVCSTTSDTACGATGVFTATPTAATTATVVADATHMTIQAIGCPGALVGDANHGFLSSTLGTAVFSPAGTLIAPTIHPATGTVNNFVNVTFDNTNAVPANVCYTTNGSTPAPTANCLSSGVTTCVVATASQAAVAATGNPIIAVNQGRVNAVLCDPSHANLTSPMQTVTYTLQVANPTITPNSGAVSVGSVITFADATAGTTFHYVTNGGPVTCAAGSGTTLAAGGVANAQGLYTATYTIQGNETTIVVVACDGTGNFIPAASSATAQFTFGEVAPTFLFPTGTYDDLLPGEQVQVQPGSSGFTGTTWLCSGATPACSTTTANACATGTPITATTACTNALPGLCFSDPVTTTGTTIHVVACALPVAGAVAVPAIIQSPSASATFTLAVSPIAFSPTPGPQTMPVTPTASLVAGTVMTPSAITTATVGNPVTICVSSTQPVPPQPVPCSSFAGLPADWTCTTATSGTASVAAALTASNTGFNAFACKDGLTYSTSAGNAYTFGPYSHTIAMTGSPADFNAGAEALATTDVHTAYVSYDATYLYVGFQSPNVRVTTLPNAYVHFYIGGPAGGTNTADTVGGLSLGGSLPVNFRGLHHVIWKNDGTLTTVDSFNGAVWAVDTTITPLVAYNGGASTFVEFRIALAQIGSPTDIHLLGGVSNQALGTGATSAIDLWTNSNVDGANFTSFQTLFLNMPFLPNAVQNRNQP